MKYYLSDIDIVYARDENGKVYTVGPDGLKPSKMSIDPMWGGLDESEISDYVPGYKAE